ncbi:hypothetical protein ACGFJ7_07755 [Actinoplanes sp. NPDC048988]|uniref:hypothetical protein n=1 Tax=Actinoplanes sp. NPDC048988 TaxID=3363901 RepID=UPI00371BA687
MRLQQRQQPQHSPARVRHGYRLPRIEVRKWPRRRLDIASTTPGLLFLDEPSTGLDPQNRASLQEHIRALRAEHETTIALTTHYLDEADSMAERVIVIDHGRIIADDSPQRLKDSGVRAMRRSD